MIFYENNLSVRNRDFTVFVLTKIRHLGTFGRELFLSGNSDVSREYLKTCSLSWSSLVTKAQKPYVIIIEGMHLSGVIELCFAPL